MEKIPIISKKKKLYEDKNSDHAVENVKDLLIWFVNTAKCIEQSYTLYSIYLSSL